VVPALAVAGALRAEGARVSFIGGARAEAELVPRAGYELRRIEVEGMSRTNPLHAARALIRAGVAFLRARSLLKELEPDAVLGGGGYVAGPVGLAALTLRIPLVLSEADSHLGLTNRVLARGARRVCLAFPLPGRAGARYRVTGRPGPPAQEDRAGARARLGLAAGRRWVLVFGGSLGARSINLAAIEAFAGEASTLDASPGGVSGRGVSTGEAPADGTSTGAVSTGGVSTRGSSAGGASTRAVSTGDAAASSMSTGAAFGVLHVAGRRDYPELAARELPAGYDLREYLDLDEFGDALAAADLVVARAGGSVFEIAASGTPAILVPYPHASADHQTANARWMADAGAAVVIADGELNAGRLAREVTELLGDGERLAAMASASEGLARPHAARDIADELLQAVRA
jgi:UDP-N-acetylglucosamine--N-acetylmuramyl-(pentapeptide) pyrophosphoryl-undecaprenol N-acetylglucosamine transferase